MRLLQSVVKCNMLSDEEIHKLWKSPEFDGSFRGLRTFQILLKTNLNESVSIKRLHNILSQDATYLIHQRTVKKFPRRKYYVHSYGELCQMDIGKSPLVLLPVA